MTPAAVKGAVARRDGERNHFFRGVRTWSTWYLIHWLLLPPS